MKIAVSKLLGSKESLNSLFKVKTGTGLQTYKIAKLVKKVNEELSLIEAARLELFKKYGEEKDGQISVKPENTEEFNREIMAFFNNEIGLDISPVEIVADKYPSELEAKDYLVLEDCGFITVKESDAK